MHFGLTEEQKLLQETVRSFVATECPAPRVRELTLRGAGRDAQSLADLGVREADDVVQHQDGAVSVRQAGDGALQIEALGIQT